MRVFHMFHSRRRLVECGSILLAALFAAPAIVRAQAAAPERAEPTALAAERQRLRAHLQRVNAEIDTLKRDRGGLGDDYRLRARMADAEALARRLMELDARTGAAKRGIGQSDAAWPSAPEARASDDRADLEAKADILSDQARRVEGQARVLAERVADLRGRQELRRRAGQLERDPFSPLEQVKRRTASATARVSGPGEASGTGPGKTGDSAGTSTPAVSPPTTTGGGSAPMGGVAIPTPGGPGTTGTGTPGATDQTGRTPSTSTTAGLNTPPAAIPIGSTGPGDSPGSVASQFRGILDAATLAEIRRLETPGSPGGNVQAMERAVSALRARAVQLAANASALRARARTAH